MWDGHSCPSQLILGLLLSDKSDGQECPSHPIKICTDQCSSVTDKPLVRNETYEQTSELESLAK